MLVETGVNITKVDYMRRVLFYDLQFGKEQLPYESVYCLIGDNIPELLTNSGINPMDCHHHLLHNQQFDNIYILGADLLPTTFSFHALAMQTHHIVRNIVERLASQSVGRVAMLTAYDGATTFHLHLEGNQIARIKHKYEGKDY